MIVAWVNVPNINARNTLDFIGLEYFFLTLRTSWGDMVSGDGSFTLFHSATSFRVPFTFSYVHYLYSKAVYFHHLKWEYCNHGIPRLSLSLSHTHTCAPLYTFVWTIHAHLQWVSSLKAAKSAFPNTENHFKPIKSHSNYLALTWDLKPCPHGN